jgi:hypothetical protein
MHRSNVPSSGSYLFSRGADEIDSDDCSAMDAIGNKSKGQQGGDAKRDECRHFASRWQHSNVISMSLSKNIAHRMKRSLNPIAICAILLSNTGCQEQLGGGNRSFSVDGAPAKTAVFGIRAGSKLGFIIFTDNTEEGTIPDSWIPSWTGQIKPAKGLGVVYKGSNEGLDINGTAYTFANGRVFLVSVREDSISVTQLNVSNDDATYDAEIGRIAELKELQEFLRE